MTDEPVTGEEAQPPSSDVAAPDAPAADPAPVPDAAAEPAPAPDPAAEPAPDAEPAPAAPAAARTTAPAAGPGTVERFGRPMRHFPVAVSSEAMALAWANQEHAPQGAAVVVDHEINPRGLHGRLWDTPQADTLSCSIVLRPQVSVEEADVAWLLAALAAARATEEVTGKVLATWWPDEVVEAESRDPVGQVRAEVQLGPGQVKAAVITVRLDMLRLDLDPATAKDGLLEALLRAVDSLSETLTQGAAAVATAYEERCGVVGNRVKVRLRPKGETRGVARHVDRAARLEVESMSGMIEKIGVNQLMELDVV